MDVESSATRLGGDFIPETINSLNSNTTNATTLNTYSQNYDVSQIIKSEDDADVAIRPHIYTPSILKNTPYVDLCSIPKKIEFINLIDSKEDYTLHTFHLGRANLENKTKVARNCTFKFEQLEKMVKLEKMQANENIEKVEKIEKIEKIEKFEKIKNYEEINLIDSSDEESEESDEYNIKREYKRGPYSNRKRKTRLKINNNTMNTNSVSSPNYTYTKNLHRENILVYSSDNKYETCDILWINTVDNEVLPNWKYTLKSIVFDKRIAEFIQAASSCAVACDCYEKCGSFRDCSCSLLNYAVNKKDFSYCYDIKHRKRHPARSEKRLINSFQSHHHIFECSQNCNCCKDRCHLSLLNSIDFGTTAEYMTNFVIQRVRKTRIVNGKFISKTMWGLFTTKDIPKFSYVMEYCGEIITNREAEMRGKVYDLETISYLFDISSDCGEDFLNIYRFYCRKFGVDIDSMERNMKLHREEDFPLVIDAKEYGNQARFINHSCNPNLISVNVHKDCKDPRFGNITLFAKREIKAGTELTIDYYYESFEGAQDVYCLCLERGCRNYLYSSK